MPTTKCPPSAALERLLRNDLAEPEVRQLEEHILQCEACAVSLNRLIPADSTLADALAATSTLADKSSHPLVVALMRRLEAVSEKARTGKTPPAGQIKFRCSACGKTLAVKSGLEGKKVKCPKCQQVVIVPSTPSAASVSSSAPGGTVNLPARSAAQVSAVRADGPTLPPRSNPGNTAVPGMPAPEVDSSFTEFLSPAQSDDELGRLGKYRILKLLGHGGMGVVYQAEDPVLKRRVAIKAMLPGLGASASARARFVREAQSLAAVEHDHIARIYDVGEERGVSFLAMEFLKGEPLDRCIDREGKLPAHEVIRIGREAAEGLSAAHGNGLVHRDVKPGNLWLEAPKRRVKILDFGLARAAEDAHLTQSGAIIGTPAYMAPEQGRGEKVDARGDLFSLGVVLYRIATGAQPFTGNDTVSTLLAIATQDPPAPDKVEPSIPLELSEVIMKLLEKDPNRRFASARELVEALAALDCPAPPSGVTRPLPGPPPPRRAAARPPGRRRRGWLVGAFGAGALALVAAAGVIVYWPTANGTVILESDDPDVEVVFDRTGPTIKGADNSPISLVAGDHGFIVKRGDFSFETDRFLIKNGKETRLKLQWVEGKVRVSADGKLLHEKDLPVAIARTPPPKADTPPETKTPVKDPSTKPTAWTPPAWGTSPLDKLDPGEIPVAEHYDGEPKGLVAVIGSRGRIMGWATAFALSPDGKLAAAAGGGSFEVVVWDVQTRKAKWFIREKGENAGPKQVRELRFSPDGKRLLVNHLYINTWATIYDVSGDDPVLLRYQTGAKKGEPIALGGNWPWFEFAGPSLVAVKSWDSKTEATLRLFDYSGAELKLTEDDVKVKYNAWGFPSNVPEFIHRTPQGQLFRVPLEKGKAGTPRLLHADLSPNGTIAAVSADGRRLAWRVENAPDDGNSRLQVWDVAATPARKIGEIFNPGAEISFSADGGTLLGTGLGAARIYRIEHDALTKIEGMFVDSQRGGVTPDNKMAVILQGSGLVQFWDLTGPNPRDVMPFDYQQACLAERRLAIAPALDSRTGQLALGCLHKPNNPKFYHGWSLAGRRPIPFAGPDAFLQVPDWQPTVRPAGDGRWFVDRPSGGQVRGFTRLGPTGWEPIVNRFGSLDFDADDVSANGKFIILQDRKNHRFQGWDCSGSEPSEAWSIDIPEHQLSLEHLWQGKGQWNYLRLSADGRRFVTCGQPKQDQPWPLVVWDNTGKEPKVRLTIPVTNPPGEYSFALSPDGNTLFHTRQNASHIIVQDIRGTTAQDLVELGDNLIEVKGLAAHPDGKHVAWWGTEGVGIFDSTKSRHVWQSRSGPAGVNWAGFADDGRHLIAVNRDHTVHVIRIPNFADSSDRGK